MSSSAIPIPVDSTSESIGSSSSLVVSTLPVQVNSTPPTVSTLPVQATSTPPADLASAPRIIPHASPLSTWYPLVPSELSSPSLKLSSSSSESSSSSFKTSPSSSEISSHSSFGTLHTSLGPLPRRRHQLSSYSTSPSVSIGPSRKRCRSPTTLPPPSSLVSPVLSFVLVDCLSPQKRFRGLPAASLQEDTIEAAVEPIITPVHLEQNVRERLDEQEDVMGEMYEHLLEIPLLRIDEIEQELQTLRDMVATSEG
ncbi:hypothetical protein Tco_0946826 [Tanacetum coccineum]